jgi:uncharacterized membrane protein
MWKIVLSLLVLDAIYLGIHASFLSKVIESVQKQPPRMRYLPAALVYVYLTVVVMGLLQYKVSIRDSFILGMCIYGIYEGTNYATLERWPLYLFVADTIWGGTLIALTTYIARYH